MYTLYYSPGACSMAVHVVLNEIGAPVTLEDTSIPKGKNRTEEFLKLNPRGQIPVLVEDGQVIREGAAMILHLLEKHKSPLLPAKGKERTAALEWLMFCNATLHPAYSRAFFLNRAVKDAATKQELLSVATDGINKLWEEVENRLNQNTYLAGKEITAADILLTVIANWSHNFPAITIGPRAKALFKQIIARPAYQQALKLENVEYKAAA